MTLVLSDCQASSLENEVSESFKEKRKEGGREGGREGPRAGSREGWDSDQGLGVSELHPGTRRGRVRLPNILMAKEDRAGQQDNGWEVAGPRILLFTSLVCSLCYCLLPTGTSGSPLKAGLWTCLQG